MKHFLALYTILSCLFVGTIRSQSLTWNITHNKPYFHNHLYFLTELNLKNTSPDTLILWITKDKKNDNSELNIGEYFFKLSKNSDFTLSQLIYESIDLSNVYNVVGSSFFKELSPNDNFTIILVDSTELSDDFCTNFINNHIVSIDKNELKRFEFDNFPTWKMLQYQYSYIILGEIKEFKR